jgi:hypothetical protein
MSDCVHCSHEIRSVEDACAWCGRWQNGHMPMCETHSTTPSIGLCVVCARPLCGDCARRENGRLFCDDPAHPAFMADHTLVATFESEFDADWLMMHLRRAGIPATAFAFREHVSSWWFPLAGGVRVFIPSSNVEAARTLLADLTDLTHHL